jgi:hypothetical protein
MSKYNISIGLKIKNKWKTINVHNQNLHCQPINLVLECRIMLLRMVWWVLKNLWEKEIVQINH